MSRTETVKVVQPVKNLRATANAHPKPLSLEVGRPNLGGPVYRSNLVGANTPPRSLPESALNSPEFITAHQKRPLDAAIDRRRFELDELDIAVASHDLSLAVGILPTRQAKGHDSAGNRARRERRRRRGVAGKRNISEFIGQILGLGTSRGTTSQGAPPWGTPWRLVVAS